MIFQRQWMNFISQSVKATYLSRLKSIGWRSSPSPDTVADKLTTEVGTNWVRHQFPNDE